MIRAVAAMLFGVATIVGASSPAGAWTRFHNNSSFTIRVAHAFDSTSGFLCGYSDGCSSNWHLSGWWDMAPGTTITVETHGYGNASHDAYGFDSLGHEWVGTTPGNVLGGSYGLPFDRNFEGCQYDFLSLPFTEYRTFFRARLAQCCGGSCPSNGTINFNN
jgi:hypothetical protein